MEQESKTQVYEEPILLLLLSKGGVLLFTYPFTKEQKLYDELIRAFLPTFTTFNTDIFPKGLNRLKFGDYVVVIDTVRDYSLCYVFKGNIINAIQKLQKLKTFMENFDTIWPHLEESVKKNRVIEIRDFSSFVDAIRDIFNFLA
ncbi:MAG: hypothetical protein ACFFFB_11995 [Candidatus Heimdallarchaeota archaeon]